eukprot:2936263-Alexandrium_andersonii.AAC.1
MGQHLRFETATAPPQHSDHLRPRAVGSLGGPRRPTMELESPGLFKTDSARSRAKCPSATAPGAPRVGDERGPDKKR